MKSMMLAVLFVLVASAAAAQPPTGGAATQAATQQYALTVSKVGAGSGTVAGAGPINCGTVCNASYVSGVTTRLTATANSGSTFTGWTGACSGAGTCVVVMSSVKNVVATFDLVTSSTATRFAKPSGLTVGQCTNSGTGTNGACTIDRMLQVITCGETGELANGTYLGTGNMINMNQAGSPVCTAGNEITIKAQTDGQVLIDGNYTHDPAYIAREDTATQVSYWNFEGFDAARGGGYRGFVVGTRMASHINFRRINAWDSKETQANEIVIAWQSSDILFEDMGIFGISPYIFMDYQDSARITFRRVWARQEGWGVDSVNSTTAQAAYNANSPLATPPLWENVIFTTQPYSYRSMPGQIAAVLNAPRDDVVAAPWLRMMGIIVYPWAGQTPYYNIIAYPANGTPDYCSGTIFQDWLVHHNGTNAMPLRTGGSGCESPAGFREKIVTRVTSVRGTSASTTLAATITPAGSFIEATTLAGTGFNYLGAGNTARLCYRYQDTVYQTGTHLWPWPMDDRIKAAIASNSGVGSQALGGTAGTGYAADTVTSSIVALLGAIPTTCNSVALFRQRVGPHIGSFIFLLLAGTAVLHQRRQRAIRSRIGRSPSVVVA